MGPRDIEESQKAWQRPEAEAERAEARPEGVPSSLGAAPHGRATEPTRLEAHAAAARYLDRSREPRALARELDALEERAEGPSDGHHRALAAARSSEFFLGLRPRPLVSLFVGALVAGVILGRLQGR